MRIKRLIEIAKENQEEILSKNTNKALHVLFDTLQEDELDDNEVLDEIYRRSKLDDTYLVSDLRDWNEDLLDQLYDQCILGDRDISDSILSLLQTEKYTCKNIKVSVERFGAFERAVDKILQLINAQEEKVISEEINNIDTEIYIARAKRKGFENKYQEHDDYNSKRWTMLKNQIYKLFENSVKKRNSLFMFMIIY